MAQQLLTDATATNSAPSGALAGVGLADFRGLDTVALMVNSTAGSGTMTVTLKLWVYSEANSTWMPAGTDATAANKGLLNGGNAIPEGPNADSITHTEIIANLRHYDRAYLEITAIGGTATAVSAYLVGYPVGGRR